MGFTLMLLSICTNIVILLLLWCSYCMMSFAHSDSPGRSNGKEDGLALLAFKARITHDPFHVLSSWNDSAPYCEWPGVICGGRRHLNRVKILFLESKGLVGSMAPEIGNLSFLRKVSLVNNSFHSAIPNEVSFLSKLRILLLHNNSFEGEIPPNISHCSNLIELNLANNNIVGKFPVQLGTLSKLQVLSIQDNNFVGQIPPSIGNLSSLQVLSAAVTGFSGSIPDSLGHMTRLLYLEVGGNKLSGIVPPTVYNLSSLIILDVGYNQFCGSLPPNLGFSLPNLQDVSFASNQFHGPIPISVSNLSKLEILYLGDNNLTGKVSIHFGGLSNFTKLSMSSNHLGSGKEDDLGFINALANCSSLTLLEFEENRFGGVLPNSIANLSIQLNRLALSHNQIFGKVPVEMGNLRGLQHLSLSANLLEGSIPSSIGTLQGLNRLYLNGNRFTGPIPPTLGNLTLLTELLLQDNQLEGKIPTSLGKCKNLLRLSLSGNSLNDIIPKEIFDFYQLIELYLGRNYFFGSIPLEVGRLINLEIFEVSENMLSSEIPSTVGACTSLEHVFMQRNLFEGPIPTSLSYLRGLQILDLSHNNFSGSIPKYLGNLKLQNLNLSFNYLEGEVPVEGVFGNSSAVSVIGNNMLCGGIPELHLSACQTQKSKEDGKLHVFKLIVTICGCGGAALCLICVICIFIIYRRRKKSKESTTFLVPDHHFKISYAQLLKATDGFSSTNLLGVGSFGSVYKCVLTQVDIVVAVKVFNNEQRGASKSFMVECEALRNIRHRNLVKILTSCSSVDFEGNDFKALIYEFMPGGNLDMWLHPHTNGVQDEQGRHLNFVQRLNIAIDMATALDYLHHHCHMQIIHCDLKPSNVLLDDDLTAHLSDFGISRILQKATGRSENQTTSIGIKGSIGYIAPEEEKIFISQTLKSNERKILQEYGVGVDVSTYGDVYSYGILLLEMFTRKRPTDEMFKDNFNLHCWVEMALHDGLMAVVDLSLFRPMEEDEVNATITITDTTGGQRSMNDKMRECLDFVIRIGVTCSAESPWDRMDITDVVKKLHLIRNIYLGVGTQ